MPLIVSTPVIGTPIDVRVPTDHRNLQSPHRGFLGGQLTPPPAPASVLTQASTLLSDSLTKHEEAKRQRSWITLRTARDDHLQHSGAIGPGDIVQLEKEGEREQEAEVELAATAMKVDSAAQNGNGSEENANSSELNGNGAQACAGE